MAEASAQAKAAKTVFATEETAEVAEDENDEDDDDDPFGLIEYFERRRRECQSRCNSQAKACGGQVLRRERTAADKIHMVNDLAAQCKVRLLQDPTKLPSSVKRAWEPTERGLRTMRKRAQAGSEPE